MPKTNLLRLLTATGLGLTAATLHGYVLQTDESNIYVRKWYGPQISMQLELSSTANLSDGNSYRSTVVAGMNAWNAQIGDIQFAPVLSSPGTHALGNGVSEIVMDSTYDGQRFSSGTLAITISFDGGDDFSEEDIIINTAFTWDSYRGPLRAAEDLQRVVTHELGHVLGLDHPDQFGQKVDALMNANVSNLDSLTSDDIAGAQALYGPPGIAAPTNDNFASAATISLTNGSVQMSSNNLVATREAGEPQHATSTGAHSVWWRWRAPVSGSVIATTLGSNFDTVLGVYTGTAVNALTRVTDNDDEELPDQNSTASRKRTSRVTFNAVGGTTYYLAVDGWGDNDNSQPLGFTGSISLTVTFSPLAPVFTTQPSSVAVNSGGSTTLTANVSVPSGATPQYQWQLNGAPISGATQSSYTITAVDPGKTGLYTVAATTSAGTTISNPAIVGLVLSTKLAGAGTEIGSNIVFASNGNIYDQVLLQGASVSLMADPGQIVRVSFIDLTKDIVQVEFSGAGTLSLVLDGASGPAAPESYNQPGVSYMKGHAGIVVTGADATTNLSVFSVGKITAVNQALFRSDVTYDGVADLAYVAILSPSGQFGGLRTANASFFATKGLTGVYAPSVEFTGPVYVGDVSASNDATPVLRLGASTEVQINGGDLSQMNGRAVQVSGINQLKFVAGIKSDGTPLPAQSNQARLEQNGVDVTSQVVVPPAP